MFFRIKANQKIPAVEVIKEYFCEMIKDNFIKSVLLIIRIILLKYLPVHIGVKH